MTLPPTLRIVLVDDHPVVRAGLRMVLEAQADIEVVAEATSGAEALQAAAVQGVDVLVLDLNLPDMNGVQVIERLQQWPHPPPVLVLTAVKDPHLALELLAAGAVGYVLKDEALEILPHAVRAVARGENWLSSAVASQVVQRAVAPRLPASPPAENLTPREMEVLRLLAQGLDNAAIARRLVITKRTVQNHVSTIYAKLGVSSRTEAALYAIRRGWAEAG